MIHDTEHVCVHVPPATGLFSSTSTIDIKLPTINQPPNLYINHFSTKEIENLPLAQVLGMVGIK